MRGARIQPGFTGDLADQDVDTGAEDIPQAIKRHQRE